MIFKGYLTGFFPKGAFGVYLSRQGVLLKDFSNFVQERTKALKGHIEGLAEAAGRPLQYLSSAKGASKEDMARSIAERDGVKEGLVCVFSVLETCMSFDVQGNRATHKLEVVRRQRKCLHYYCYYLDAEFGLMHIRLQSWLPFDIQIYVNGREWLARQLDQRGIAYDRYDNKLTQIADLKTAQTLCERFTQRKWLRVLHALARRVNPFLGAIRKAGFGDYYWTLAQAEYATDIFFRDRETLEALLPSLMEISISTFSAEDVLRFLGRKPHGNFQGQVTSDRKKRPEGRRVNHRMKGNSIKWYDAVNLLRIETTINQPREFRVLRVVDTPQGRKRRWQPMGKGVANLWRYAQVGRQANYRYLNSLAHAQPTGKVIAELEGLCHPKTNQGKRYARFNPITQADCDLFSAILAGEHALNGFRNKNLQTYLYSKSAKTPAEQRQRSAHVSRLVAKLHGHGLISKVKGSRLYRSTPRGIRLMSAAILCRNKTFPDYAGLST
ncbi:MAG: hypothetical protein Q8L64_03185 [bacterium]|nr:hypothetical protein [bacterium]